MKVLVLHRVSSLRWHPLSIGSGVDVSRVFVIVYGFEAGVGKIKISPMNDVIKSVNSEGEGFVIVMREALDDPQANLKMNFSNVY